MCNRPELLQVRIFHVPPTKLLKLDILTGYRADTFVQT